MLKNKFKITSFLS